MDKMRLVLSGLVVGLACLTLSGCYDGSSSDNDSSSSTSASSSAASTAVVAATASCSDLTGVDLTDIGGDGSYVETVTETISDAGNTLCVVEGVLSPAIQFEAKLPTTTWTQRYLQAGCGGLCGSITLDPPASDGCVPLNNDQLVIAATDMGHEGGSGEFGLDTQLQADFAYRAQHITSLAVKKLIKAFYGQDPSYSYFDGCSDGGREALMEAQRYPTDFNGIIAGAPAMIFQFQNSLHHGWLAESNMDTDGNPIVVADRLPILHNAVIAACDSLDGVEDGLLTDPRTCHFDPGTIQCADDATDTSACLTAAEVTAIRKFYTGPTDPDTNEALLVGSPQYGSELNWEGVFVPSTATGSIFSEQIALSALRYLIFATDPGAAYTLDELEFNTATVELLRANHPQLDATNPDLSAFKAAGGKLIMWHGWADQHITPLGTIAYQEAMNNYMDSDGVSEFERLYLLPGVAHCGGGEGLDQVDFVTAMFNWVENGEAPDEITTSKLDDDGNVTMTRPVYPYPEIAVYDGTGDINDASSYSRGSPLYNAVTRQWAGEDFFTPYTPAD